MEIAKKSTDVSAEWFDQLFKKTELLPKGAGIVDVGIKPIGTGQMGYTLKAQVTYSDNSHGLPSSFIVKLASEDDTARKVGLDLGIYESEVKFYKDIAPNTTMELPNCLFAEFDEEGWLTILLEDISPIAKPGDVLAGGTVEQAKSAMLELAKLQAPFWDNEECLSIPWASAQKAAPLFALAVSSVEPFLERFAGAFTDQQLEMFKQLMPLGTSWFEQWESPLTMVHGDYRLDNMLLAIDQRAPAITTIDWQTVRMAPPMIDVSYYLGACLPPDVRRRHEKEILQYYQAELSARGIDYAWDQLWRDYRFYAVYGLLLCAFALKVPQTERGDQMFAQTASKYADMVADLQSLELISV